MRISLLVYFLQASDEFLEFHKFVYQIWIRIPSDGFQE